MDRPSTQLMTDRLLIRRFRAADGEAMHAYLGDPEVVHFEPYDPLTPDECRHEAARRATDPDFWAVCLLGGAGEAVLVGSLWLHPMPLPGETRRDATTWELGYVFGRAWWGRGFATEACRALVDRTFACGARRVEARCDPRNEASWRLLERLGMRREAHLVRAATFGNDEDGQPVWHDAYVYAVLHDGWSGTPPETDGGLRPSRV